MRALLGLAALVPAAALAVQPQPVKGGDPRVCEAIYSPDQVLEVTAMVGEQVTLRFGEHETVSGISASDTQHLDYLPSKNVAWLKAQIAMPPQPISILAVREDGSNRDYMIQWTALEEKPPATTTPGSDRVAVAGPVVAIAKEPAPRLCYKITYRYPAEASAEQAAKWRAAQAKAKGDAAEIALRQQTQAGADNYRYVAMGDMALAPTTIFDGHNTTELHFPGNIPMPTIYTVSRDGMEAVASYTAEDNGVVKLHGVWPIVRLREAGLVLCLFNRGYNPIGSDPGTGTTSANVLRTVGR